MSEFTYVNHLPSIIEQLRRVAAQHVQRAALDITTQYTADAPKRTGFMASSAYLVTHDDSTYGASLSGTGPLLPELPRAENDQTAYAAVAAEYACYLEYGTSRMSAQPAFVPAVDTAAKRFRERMSDLNRDIHAANAG
jgi:hypothetical protein